MIKLKQLSYHFNIKMPTIDIAEKIKKDLIALKKEYGCKTFSEVVNILIKRNTIDFYIGTAFNALINEITSLKQTIDKIDKKIGEKSVEVSEFEGNARLLQRIQRLESIISKLEKNGP